MADHQRLETYHFYEQEWESYEALREEFEWELPEEFNIATYVCDRWATDPGRVAIFAEDDAGNRETVTFWQLRRAANQLANHLDDRGVGRGDRIGINTGSRPEAAIAHVAAWKLGAVSVPLSTLFGPDALGYRLADSDARVLVVDDANVDTAIDVAADLDALETVLTVDVPESDQPDFWTALDGQPSQFETRSTTPDDDALLAYTSGTTGDPKGVRHGHRFLLGYLPGLMLSVSNADVRESDVYWTVGSWAWIAPLIMVLYPLYYGRPIVAYNGEYDPEDAFRRIERYGVSNMFMAATALRMMMQVEDPAGRFDLDSMRTLLGGGESVGQTVTDWADEVFGGAAVHEAYGQTEVNPVVGECQALLVSREGTMGRPTPGREVAILDPETLEEQPPGEVGEIAVRTEGDPGVMKEYWNKPEATDRTIRDGWLMTGDLGVRDEHDYVAFRGRRDDVIISSGYRLSPAEIEDSVTSHPAVADVGVIGVPHDVRGEIPKAFVVLADDAEPSDDLREDLREHVRDRLAKHEYPREIEFVESLPKTTTGKLRRKGLREREGLEP